MSYARRVAWQRGFSDYYTGEDCPYDRESVEAAEWWNGWRSADIRESERYG